MQFECAPEKLPESITCHPTFHALHPSSTTSTHCTASLPPLINFYLLFSTKNAFIYFHVVYYLEKFVLIIPLKCFHVSECSQVSWIGMKLIIFFPTKMYESTFSFNSFLCSGRVFRNASEMVSKDSRRCILKHRTNIG